MNIVVAQASGKPPARPPGGNGHTGELRVLRSEANPPGAQHLALYNTSVYVCM